TSHRTGISPHNHTGCIQPRIKVFAGVMRDFQPPATRRSERPQVARQLGIIRENSCQRVGGDHGGSEREAERVRLPAGVEHEDWLPDRGRYVAKLVGSPCPGPDGTENECVLPQPTAGERRRQVRVRECVTPRPWFALLYEAGLRVLRRVVIDERLPRCEETNAKGE